jgi:hypothetical protein
MATDGYELRVTLYQYRPETPFEAAGLVTMSQLLSTVLCGRTTRARLAQLFARHLGPHETSYELPAVHSVRHIN